MEYIQRLAIREDLEAIKICLEANYYATCCFAAAMQYVELGLSISFPFHSLRIKFEPSEDSMMIDSQTCRSLELIQNLQNPNSKACLFGLLNQTLTPMGARRLRVNIMQPSTNKELLVRRYEALAELTSKEDIFFAVRQSLKSFVDVDKVLTAMSYALIYQVNTIPKNPTVEYFEQQINDVIMLKQFVKSIPLIREAIGTVESDLLKSILDLFSPHAIADVEALIDNTINEDITYQSQPLDLRNQRTYAVKSGVNGFLDVARQTYKENTEDALKLVDDLAASHSLPLEVKYDTGRAFYVRIPVHSLEDRTLPEIFINVYRRNKMVECQTLDLVKWNQKITDSHMEVVQLSDGSVRRLIDSVREEISPLFKISEAIALLDMLASFAHMVTTQDYVRPELTSALAINHGRHPIIEKIRSEKFIPNGAFADQRSRFQIITGCNMSGKSTYIRSLALLTIMAQLGCFVPASFATFPVSHQLFARVSIDDSTQANVSSFSLEMRETAFILRNIDQRSMVIIDELGRGTSTRDGLCIAIAVAEALVESHALVWFVTHFRDLPKILAERSGVVNLHLEVNLQPEHDKMTMLYRVANGWVEDENYGIALAKVVNLPQGIISKAEEVSKKLKEITERKKKSSKTIAIQRRRKLILSLYQQLQHAKEGNMEGRVLATWLKNLQDEFVRRMAAIDEDIAAAGTAQSSVGANEDAEMTDVEQEEEDEGPTTPNLLLQQRSAEVRTAFSQGSPTELSSVFRSEKNMTDGS
ncbi:uncharacterized protein KY384_008978 [Bacidia gigantensis]|uniref:uncharacterized protein n=1 Tax=Bacidia gigantensis TaxID=2732470 RepID=UPI001D04EDA9|nr:uncharacterized protein KY384_008978 [Bacidia gigantensis]KAG8525334.1 hypothetical protein KY384_008978 [Bacidia gigantensis]